MEPSSAGSVWKYIIASILALGCGFLTFNFSYILRVSHAHIALTHHHKAQTFCAFIGCKGLNGKQEHVKTEAELKMEETARILGSRVCGSPAVDGYAHVVPKCLEESPTSRWWQEYYKAGGLQKDLVAHIEPASDYDGLAVQWGLKNTKASAEECAAACLAHMPGVIQGPFQNLPCNAFAWCPDEVCFEPDAHHHTKGDCWLKFTEGPASPEVNMRGDLPDSYRKRHATAPARVQWVSGVLLPRGIAPTNGTWGPRWYW